MMCTLYADDAPEAVDLGAKLSARVAPDGPGLVVLVARDGKNLFAHGYGFADREKKIPATPDTRFRIGSVTKQFTAAAILALQEQGKLSIEDTLAKYFPGYPGGDKITLHQMLNHTSGLKNYTTGLDFDKRVTQPIKPVDLVAYFRNDPPDFPPGEQFNYSNTNYVLLGQIVEKVSGMSYGDYLQKQFFGPLGLHDTGVWQNATPPDHGAKGYSFDGKQAVPAVDWDMTWAGGAGELYSTVGDLWRWTEALQSGRVLSSTSLQEMKTVATVTKKEAPTNYGMGLYQANIDWLAAVGHGGGLPGYLSFVMWFPGEKVTIVALTNLFPPGVGTNPFEIVKVAAQAFLGPEMAAAVPKVDPTINPATYSDYVGRYDYNIAIMEITVENGRIFAQLTGQPRGELFPSGPDVFFFKVVAARLAFQRDKTGAVVAVALTQDLSNIYAPKLPGKDDPVLSPEALDAFVGRYQFRPQAVITITRRDSQLFAQFTGQPETAIFPKSDHAFYSKSVPASAEFVSGADGKITGMILHEGDSTMSAPKLTDSQ